MFPFRTKNRIWFCLKCFFYTQKIFFFCHSLPLLLLTVLNCVWEKNVLFVWFFPLLIVNFPFFPRCRSFFLCAHNSWHIHENKIFHIFFIHSLECKACVYLCTRLRDTLLECFIYFLFEKHTRKASSFSRRELQFRENPLASLRSFRSFFWIARKNGSLDVNVFLKGFVQRESRRRWKLEASEECFFFLLKVCGWYFTNRSFKAEFFPFL